MRRPDNREVPAVQRCDPSRPEAFGNGNDGRVNRAEAKIGIGFD